MQRGRWGGGGVDWDQEALCGEGWGVGGGDEEEVRKEVVERRRRGSEGSWEFDKS